MVEALLVTRMLADYFRERSDLAAVYLFGSVARGTAGPTSDIDVGALYRTTPAATLEAQPFADEAALSQLFGRRVQVVIMNTAPVDLVHRVLRDGILVIDRDKGRRIAFEVRSRNEYFDLLPILREYRKQATR
jgi:predicted nucleotidyltransferase